MNIFRLEHTTEVEFGSVVFAEGGKTGKSGKNPLK